MTVAPAIALDQNLWIGKDLQQFRVTTVSDRGEAFAQENWGKAAGIFPRMLRPYRWIGSIAIAAFFSPGQGWQCLPYEEKGDRLSASRMGASKIDEVEL